jgi:hypothetical protein
MDPKLYANVMNDARLNNKAAAVINNTGTAQARNKRVRYAPTYRCNTYVPTSRV